MSNVAAYEKLVARGCKCGSDDPQTCPLHPEPHDNRGLAAFFKAGMPLAFPFDANCAICGAPGLIYPDVVQEDAEREGGPIEHRPTLICPRCSTRSAERALRREVEETGRHVLNGKSVFGGVGVAA